MALGERVKGRRENTERRWNVKTAMVARPGGALLFIFVYTHCLMQFVQLDMEAK